MAELGPEQQVFSFNISVLEGAFIRFEIIAPDRTKLAVVTLSYQDAVAAAEAIKKCADRC